MRTHTGLRPGRLHCSRRYIPICWQVSLLSSGCIRRHLRWFFFAFTSVPIFLIARRNFDLRTAHMAAWVWAFFRYAINFSATTMWYHSCVALLLALLFLLVLSLASSDSLLRYAGFGALLGFTALTNPVMVGISPILLGWL